MRAVVFAVDVQNSDLDVEESLAELSQLADSAGVIVVGELVQRRGAPEPSTYLGTGKVVELAELMEETEADMAICDDELTPLKQETFLRCSNDASSIAHS